MSYREIYAILDQDHPERFNNLISNLSNPSTSDEQDESLFYSCKETDPNTVVDKLVNLLEHSLHIDVRKMSAILLGNIFETYESTRSRVVDKLLNLLEDSLDIDVRKMSAILLGNIFEKYESTQSRVVDKLVNLLEHSLHIDVRKMSAILLGNIFVKSKSTSQSRVKISCLLDCVVKEENRPIIEVLGDTISKLAPNKDGADKLFERLASDDTSVQESTLLIFPQLMQYVDDSYLVSYTMRLHDIFMNCLGNVGSANVRIAALIAATSFIQWTEIDRDLFEDLFEDLLPGSFIQWTEIDWDWFEDLLPGMMQCLVEVLNGGDEAMKQKALVLLIKLAQTKPSFFKKRLVEVVERMLQIADTESLEEGTRNLAIKFVITLVEYVINRKLVSYIMPLHGVFKSCLENVGLGSANVRIAALIAATSFIQCLMSDGDRFQDLLPDMMQCLVDVLNGGDEVLNGGDEAMKQKALVSLIKLAETNPSFFTERLVEVLWSMLQIAEAESLDDRTRDLAIEFVIMLEKVSNRGPAHIHVRAMSAFLLGNLFKQCHTMSESTQLRVNVYLLACVVKEENKPIIEILGYSISMLAPDEDVAYFIVDRVASLQESALLVFPHVVQYVMASNVPFTLRLRIVFKNRLRDVGSANVRIAALIAATSFIQCVMSSSDGDWFQDLLMQCLDESFNGGDEAMTQKALVLLIELAETKPSFFTKRLVEVVGSMSQIAEAEILEEGTRNLAIKFLITLNKAHAPDTSMPDMLEIVGNLPQFRLQEGIASDQTRTPAIEKLLKQFREKLPPKTWASTWSSLRLESILAHKEN